MLAGDVPKLIVWATIEWLWKWALEEAHVQPYSTADMCVGLATGVPRRLDASTARQHDRWRVRVVRRRVFGVAGRPWSVDGNAMCTLQW